MSTFRDKGGIHVDNIPCVDTVNCGSSDALALYEHEDKHIDGFCFSCEQYFPDPLNGGKVHTEKKGLEISSYEKVEDIHRYPIRAIEDRGISLDAATKYGVRVELSQTTGEPTAHYFPAYKKGKLTGYVKKDIATKEIYSIGDAKQVDLFGQHLCGNGGKLLVIVEGKEDALAAYDMFRLKGKKYRVVALPNGANARAVKNNSEWIEKFETIILALDQDEAGEKATKAISDVLSTGKVKIASFSENDPNDMLVKGKVEEFYSSIMNATEYRPDGIVSIDDIFDQAIKPVEWGASWPWKKLTELTFGRRRKELYGLGAGTGTGKTELFKEVIDHILDTEDSPVGLLFLEEEPAMTAKILAGKSVNKTFHIPDSGWKQEELAEALNNMRGRVFLYDHWGSKDYEGLRAKIRYMVVTLGIKDIFLDHLTALVAEEADENKALGRIMANLAALTQELDFTLYFISHLTTPSGIPHEEGGRVTSSQFRGSRAIAFWANYLFGLERNQQADDVEERHTTTFRVLKDRYTGRATGEVFYMGYNQEDGRFYEKEAPVQVVEDEF